MKLRSVALATLLVLLSLCHSSTQLFSNNNNPFDPYPHPPFPEIDCDKVRESYEKNGNTCPEVFSNVNEPEHDYRVCAEFRVWYHSHCQMMSRHCQNMKDGLNLIGTCHHKTRPRKPGHHRKPVPYRKCDTNSDQSDYNDYYCPMGKQEDHICGVYMKTYDSMCHLLVEFCRDEKNYELAKVISPKMHKSLFKNHNYYDKCGMFSPLGGQHTRDHFKVIYPQLVLRHNLTKSSTDVFNHKIRPTMFKYDHVCKNQGKIMTENRFKKKMERDGYTLRESDTLIHDKSYEKGQENEALRAQNGECSERVNDENQH